MRKTGAGEFQININWRQIMSKRKAELEKTIQPPARLSVTSFVLDETANRTLDGVA